MINTRQIATELRLSHWAGIMRRRIDSGLSIKTFCETSDIRPNVYFYWQRKLRESAYLEMMFNTPSAPDDCTIRDASSAAPIEKALSIEINGCRVLASENTDTELLSKVCKVLVSLC